MVFDPRPKQKEVLKYTSGLMGVAAVPGSGKTRTLSALAAKLITEGHITEDQEVLIVTLVNAAANHFAQQVGEFVKAAGLLPGMSYRVRTLHGLANDIVRERPGLVGLTNDFGILDERESESILQDAVDAWVRTHPHASDVYIDADIPANKAQYISRDKWPQAVRQVASAFIKKAKDSQLDPEDIAEKLSQHTQFLPLAEASLAIYESYQRAINQRGVVDFDDLIRLAVQALKADPDYCTRLQARWPYILEDEAQDSSLTQQTLLDMLTKEKGNWVRMGDPNQAIYETFTTAHPKYLREFIQRKGVIARELPNSGRSTRSIMALANQLIEWSLERHPIDALSAHQPLTPPYIEPTPPDDPQPNPSDDPSKVFLFAEELTAGGELQVILNSLQRWLPENQDKTVAVLFPRNDRGAEMVRLLKQANIEVIEMLRSSSTTRETAGALTYILNTLVAPGNPATLAQVFRVWRRDDRDDPIAQDRVERIAKTIKKCKLVEDYLYPHLGNDWLESDTVAQLLGEFDDETVLMIEDHILQFRTIVRRWHAAVSLPIDQLILTIAGDLFVTAADLAIAHSLALYLRRLSTSTPTMRLPEHVTALMEVAQNKRRVVDLAEDGSKHNPDDHKGKVTIATMHAAKGLEWDRVYLASVNNYSFPSAEPQDRYIGEPWWGRDRLNLQAEALGQLDALQQKTPYTEGIATQSARLDYAAERLRLLYVGITRARQELIMTWNTGRDGKVFQATSFVALQNWWNAKSKTSKD
jgi:DNA helicase II / ATP-dependent DNA helicase PcrA